MTDAVRTKIDSCTGCNRCVRECPMETANITYQDEAGNIKVKIDSEKCIACGLCVSACKHDARYYADDTDRFFDDLKAGVPITLIAAPSIRTNIPEYKKLFTCLRNLGAGKIFDVSLGADICIWAHVRYMEKNNPVKIITQPCPAVVNFCEMYCHDLLKNLSPVHSPMACISVYLRKYRGITGNIAALSPCIGKTDEFRKTKYAQYNVTFAKLLDYLKKNNIGLPQEETGFDNDESGLGRLFPMPGGLRENLEYHMEKRIHVARADGVELYDKLREYADTSADFLPDVFDVLNCSGGCNSGTGCRRGNNFFEIDKTMDAGRCIAAREDKREYFKKLYKTYDAVLELPDFMREYRAVPFVSKKITDEDINRAFGLLGKTDYAKQNIDCGSCGNLTCHGMARKIALGVNIPINCIVKSMEDAKKEHLNNMHAQEQLDELEKRRESDERMRIMLDTSPLCAHFWDENLEIVDCNQAAVIMFGLSDKKEYIKKYFDLTPEFQPDGERSVDKLKYYINKTYETGHERIDWMRQSAEKEPIPVELTMVRVDFKGRKLIAGYCRDLREHIRMMSELEAAQLTASSLLESNPQVNILFDDKFNVINCNPAAVRFFGFSSKDEMLAGAIQRVKESIPLYQPDGTLSISLDKGLDAAVKKGYIKFNTEVILRGNTISLNVEFRRIPYQNSFAVLCYLYDLTQLREREKELIGIREQNEFQLAKLNLVVHAAKIVLWDMEIAQGDKDPLNDAKPFMWTDEFRRLLGYSDVCDFPNLVGSFTGVMHPDDRERNVSTFFKHLMDKTGKTPYDIEIRIRKKSGEYGYYRATGDTIRDSEGNPIRVAGALMDIGATKKILLDNELQLIKLNLMVRATKIGLWDMEVVRDDPVNPKNAFTWSNEFRYMLGYTGENDFPNLLSSWSNCIHPDDIKMVMEVFERHIMDKTGRTPYDIEYRMFKKNGECAYYRDSGETIRDSFGNPIRVAGSLLDVTVVKNLIHETERQRMEAEAANRAKSVFLSTMSHEIRTPMNAILGITEIQLQNTKLESGVREGFEKIYNSGDLLLGIINDILDLSRIENGKMELIIARYETSSLISDTAQLNMMHIGSKTIEFELNIDENIPASLMGDEMRIKQILNNLLSNAFKYTEAGLVVLSIRAEAVPEKNEQVSLIFGVSDTGQGMTPEQVGKLFDEYARFNQEANRSTVGTGLGMSITRNLIRLMNGEISVESTPGKGSVFTVRLPQTRINSDILGKENVANLHLFRTRSKAQMRRAQITREIMPYGSVLIVDDVETNIYVARGLMSPYRLKIESVESGFAAIERIKQGHSYDIIFMDHMMPKMDGIETTKIIRGMGYRNSIVALTANAIARQTDIFMGNGFDDFISKPIDIRQLNILLNKYVRDRHPAESAEIADKYSDAGNEQVQGAQQAVSPRTAEIFMRDAKKAIATLEALFAKNDFADEENLKTYIISIHGMKSALANIGKTEQSSAAFDLETAGRKNSTETIIADTPAFLDSLRSIVEELSGQKKPAAEAGGSEDIPHLVKALNEIKKACEEYDEKSADRVISELREKTWAAHTNEFLGKIAEQLLHSDFDEIASITGSFLKTLPGGG